MIRSASPIVVVAGCGRVGSFVADRLDRDGCSVRVIDSDPRRFTGLPPRFAGTCLEGEPLDPAVLEKAGAGEARFFIAATDRDELNLVLAVLCRRVFALDDVAAAFRDPTRAASCRRMGILAVCTSFLEIEEFIRRLEEELLTPGGDRPAHRREEEP